MGVLVYAAVDDLEAWLQDDVPDNATALLRSASLLVRQATRCDYYDIDSSGKPSDVDTLQAFNDATCCQAAMWISAGIDPQGGIPAVVGASGIVTSSGIGTGKVTRDASAITSAANVAALQDSVQSLCPASAEILLDAGLCQNGPWMIG